MRGRRNRNRRRKKEIPGDAHHDHSHDIDTENEDNVNPARHGPGNEARPKPLELLPSLATDLRMLTHERTSVSAFSGCPPAFHRPTNSRGSLRRRILSTTRALHRSIAM